MTMPETIAMQTSVERDYKNKIISHAADEAVKFVPEAAHKFKMRKSKSVLTRPLVMTIVFLTMNTFQIGYYIGVVSNIQGVVEHFLNETIFEREGFSPSEERLTNLWAIIVAIFFLGGVFGNICNKWILENFSRKRGHMMNVMLGFVAIGILFSARYVRIWELLLVGRFVVGIHCGIYSGHAAVYLTEISPKEARGAITTTSNVGICFGILAGQVMGFPDIFGTDELWAFSYGFGIFPCLAQVLLVYFCVESPRYLLMIRHDEEAARTALQTLRQSQSIDVEIEEMKDEMKANTKVMSITEIFQYGPYRRSTLLATVSQFTLHMCGLGGVLFYSNAMFQEGAGLSPANAAYTTSGVGLATIIMTFVMIPVSEKAGRRRLNLIGNSCLIVIMLLLTITLALKETVDVFNIASIVLLLVYPIFFFIGPGSVPWMLVGDLFTQQTRPVGSSLAISFNWLGAFIVGYIFPPLQRAITVYVFVPFALYLTLVVIFFYFSQPETKGKTVQEVMAMFEKSGDFPQQNEGYFMSDLKNEEPKIDHDSNQV